MRPPVGKKLLAKTLAQFRPALAAAADRVKVSVPDVVKKTRAAGAGRPRLPEGERKVKTSISLTQADFDLLLKEGEGNVSRGIQELCAAHRL